MKGESRFEGRETGRRVKMKRTGVVEWIGDGKGRQRRKLCREDWVKKGRNMSEPTTDRTRKGDQGQGGGRRYGKAVNKRDWTR